MNSTTVFIQVIKSHIDYLNNIQKNINGSGNYCGTNHKSCTLGKWLYGTAADEVKELGAEAESVFQKLLEPHEQFHKVSSLSIEAFNNNDHKLAKQSLLEMIYLSDKLIKLLIELNDIAAEADVQIKSQAEHKK